MQTNDMSFIVTYQLYSVFLLCNVIDKFKTAKSQFNILQYINYVSKISICNANEPLKNLFCFQVLCILENRQTPNIYKVY